MGSLTRRLRQCRLPAPPSMRVIGYGSVGVAKIEFSSGGPAPGLYPIEALGLTFAGSTPPITHVQVLKRGADHG